MLVLKDILVSIRNRCWNEDRPISEAEREEIGRMAHLAHNIPSFVDSGNIKALKKQVDRIDNYFKANGRQ